MVTKVAIEEFLQLQQLPVLDVRSPGEYAQAHIPGAHNLPLFSNEERKIVGTIYKQQGKQPAIKSGLEFFGVKMRKMVEEVEAITTSLAQKEIVVHCWRGGMRSAAVAWLLDLYGYKVYTIVGGYKAYRRWVLAQFQKPYYITMIGGYTGSNKTALLKSLNVHKIDLEQIANHQGSAFGGIDCGPQPSQEMFENLLALQLHQNEKEDIFLEDESQRIGNLIIPNAFWATMRSSKVLFLNISFEQRLKNILENYGHLPVEKLKAATERIAKRFGPNETKITLQYFDEGNIEAAFGMLLKYYDKLYQKSLVNRERASELINEIHLSKAEDFNIEQFA